MIRFTLRTNDAGPSIISQVTTTILTFQNSRNITNETSAFYELSDVNDGDGSYFT